MNVWEQDRNLLNQLEARNGETEIQRLKKELLKTQQESEKRFQVILDQNDLIKRYRALGLELAQEKKPNLDAPLEPGIDKTPLKRKTPGAEPEMPTNISKVQRLNQLIEHSQIKYPTTKDGMPETLIGQKIWNTIIQCFRKYPGGLVTEQMIIQEGGKNLLHRSNEYYLDKSMIHRFFTHKFSFQNQDQTISVRPLAGGSWIVIMPEWLQIQLKNDCLFLDRNESANYSLACIEN